MSRWYVFAALICPLLSASASAGILYSNGPINGNIRSYGIDVGSYGIDGASYAVANSFALSAGSTITGVTFGDWAYPGDPPLTVQWGISGLPDYGSPFGGGSAATLTSLLVCSAGDPNAAYTACSPGVVAAHGEYDLYYSSFSIPGIVLGAGTYYLTLQNATMSNQDEIGWDINNGPSVAYDSGTPGNVANGVGLGSNSEAFAVLGSTPEPGTFALLGGGLLLAAGMRRKFNNR